MKKHKFLIYLALLLVLTSLLYISYTKNIPILSIGYILGAIIIGIVVWLAWEINKKLSFFLKSTIKKQNDIEKLLFDIRDGKKSYFKEKRKHPRINTENKVHTKITNKGKENIIPVKNISYGGALLGPEMGSFIKGELLKLNMYLPLFPQPIDIDGKIVRLDMASKRKSSPATIGIEYTGMSRSDRSKLIETVDSLSKETQ